MSRTSAHALVAVLAVCAICCTRWGPPLHPTRLSAERRATNVLVTLTDRRHFEVGHARVLGNTLLGDTVSFADAAREFPIKVAIPFASIDSVYVRQTDQVGTAVALVGGGVVIALLIHEMADALNKGDDQAKEGCHGSVMTPVD
jgi:ABC-type Fe3+-siderophore transport system permease subunit